MLGESFFWDVLLTQTSHRAPGLYSLLAWWRQNRHASVAGGRNNGVGGQPGQLSALALTCVSNESVGDADMPDGAIDAFSRQELGHAASRAACNGVFLKGNQVLMLRHL